MILDIVVINPLFVCMKKGGNFFMINVSQLIPFLMQLQFIMHFTWVQLSNGNCDVEYLVFHELLHFLREIYHGEI